MLQYKFFYITLHYITLYLTFLALEKHYRDMQDIEFTVENNGNIIIPIPYVYHLIYSYSLSAIHFTNQTRKTNSSGRCKDSSESCTRRSNQSKRSTVQNQCQSDGLLSTSNDRSSSQSNRFAWYSKVISNPNNIIIL